MYRQRLRAASKAGRPIAQVADDGTLGQCQKLAALDKGDGFAIDGLTFCNISKITGQVLECKAAGGCKVVGTWRFRFSMIGLSWLANRDFLFKYQLDSFGWTGAYNVPMRHEFKCSDVDGDCAEKTDWETTKTISQWWSSALTVYTWIMGTDEGGTGPDKERFFWAFNKLSTLNANVQLAPGGFTCNTLSAEEGEFPDGCVVAHVVEVLVLSAKDDSNHKFAARHIDDAQLRPQLTKPATPNKKMPGRPGTAWLTHIAKDKPEAKVNRPLSVATCIQEFGADYTKGGYQCDEYPPASTYEGSLTQERYSDPPTKGMFSVLPVLGPDNGSAGGKLGSFYKKFRMLDQAEFWIVIDK